MWARLVERWQGVALTLIGVVSTVWLSLTGQLALYIHPRYFGFTAAMAVVGGLLALAALATVPTAASPLESDGHVDGTRASPARRRVAGAVVGSLIVLAAAVALLVLPPATLTTHTALQRDVERTSLDLAGDAPSLSGADPSTFTVKDWALLLRQQEDPAAFAGQAVAITGFVAPVPGGSDDAFYVARFRVTCCAVDAQPIGVPVHLPGWQERFSADDWVQVTGGVAADPAGGAQLVVLPEAVEPTEQPEQPYVY